MERARVMRRATTVLAWLSLSLPLWATILSPVDSFFHGQNEPNVALPPTTFDVTSMGAKGDGVTDDTQAFMKAWRAACPTQSSAIYVPGHQTFVVGPITFRGPCASNVLFKIDGTIVAPSNPIAWESINKPVWLEFVNLKDFTIGGSGTLDGKGQKWWSQSCKISLSPNCRKKAPTALVISSCQNVQVRDLIIKDSQQMHLKVEDSNTAVVSGLQIIAPSNSPNTDGIHLSRSKNVTIEDCDVGTGDDCISIQTGTSNVQVKGGSCGPGHGISIGGLGEGNTEACVSDVYVDGISINGANNGLRIKSWQGGLGAAYRIKFTNVHMNNVKNPIIVTQYYCDQTNPCKNQSAAVVIHDVTFSNITGTSATGKAIQISCSDAKPCSGIHMENVQLTMAGGSFTPASSFCWNALGSTMGSVQPSSCLTSGPAFGTESQSSSSNLPSC